MRFQAAFAHVLLVCGSLSKSSQSSGGALDTEGIMGAMCETRGDGVLDNTYVRLLRDFDAKAEGMQRILRECFRHQAMVVVVEQPYPHSGAAQLELSALHRRVIDRFSASQVCASSVTAF